MEPLKYDVVQITPALRRDGHLIEYAKRKLIQIKRINGRIRIKINGLEVFKTLEIDGFEMMFACRDCTIKYGKVIQGKKSLLGGRYLCPVCHKYV